MGVDPVALVESVGPSSPPGQLAQELRFDVDVPDVVVQHGEEVDFSPKVDLLELVQQVDHKFLGKKLDLCEKHALVVTRI